MSALNLDDLPVQSDSAKIMKNTGATTPDGDLSVTIQGQQSV